MSAQSVVFSWGSPTHRQRQRADGLPSGSDQPVLFGGDRAVDGSDWQGTIAPLPTGPDLFTDLKLARSETTIEPLIQGEWPEGHDVARRPFRGMADMSGPGAEGITVPPLSRASTLHTKPKRCGGDTLVWQSWPGTCNRLSHEKAQTPEAEIVHSSICGHLRRHKVEALHGYTCDLRQRLFGTLAGRHWLSSNEAVLDAILVARVHSTIGRVNSHPGALDIRASNGTVQVRGPILAREYRRTLACIRAVRGVKGVEDHLEVHRTQNGQSTWVAVGPLGLP